MKKDLVIVGAGPAGIFSALEIVKLRPEWKVVLIEKGQKIGEIGSTGRATGPHLHWVVMWRDKRVDPAVFIENSKAFCE